jgi:hypothetical protein
LVGGGERQLELLPVRGRQGRPRRGLLEQAGDLGEMSAERLVGRSW